MPVRCGPTGSALTIGLLGCKLCLSNVMLTIRYCSHTDAGSSSFAGDRLRATNSKKQGHPCRAAILGLMVFEAWQTDIR